MQNTELEMGQASTIPEIGRRPARTRGNDLREAAIRYGYDENKLVDFSSNVNPLGPSRAAGRAVKKALARIGRYPDPEQTDLRKALGRYFGIKQEQVACGAGATGLIHLIPRVFRPKKVLIPAPTFSEYAVAVENAGGEAVLFPLKEREGFRIDPVEMSFAMQGVDMAFLCNPNNPTGQLVPKAELLELVHYAHRYGVRLVVDEAFIDFSDPLSIVKEAVQTSHVISIRTFSSFFGLPGLRIGFAVAGEETIGALRNSQEPWPVTVAAEQAAIAALNDWGHGKKTRRLIAKEGERLLSALRILPGLETFPSAANFILIKLVSKDALTITDELGRRGLLARDCSAFPGLDNSYLRLSIRTRRENKRLVKALRELLL